MNSHSITTILLNIPLSLQSDVLGSWLTNADICKLDSAFCSKELRSQFLNLLASGVILIHTPQLTEIDEINSWMAWVVQRKVCIEACHLSSAVPPALYMRFFVAVSKTLKKATVFANRKVHTKSDFSSIIATIACCCKNISEIQLQNGESLGSLENLLHASQESLTVLNLLRCDISELKLRYIHLPSLRRLVLEDCSGVSETVSSGFLGAAPNLEILNYRNVSILSQSINISVKLRVLILFSSPQLTDAMFCNIVHSCPLLEVVGLSSCMLLTDKSLLKLAQHAKCLNALFLSQNTNFSDTLLQAIAKHCGERLKLLGLWQCTSITNVGLNHITEWCHQLEGVYVDYMNHISTAAVASVLRVNPLLREVSLGSYSEEDGDALLTVLSTCCPLLMYCNIYFLKGYTEAGVYAVIEACPDLRTIVVNPDCIVVNPLSRLLWSKLYPCLKVSFKFRIAPVLRQYFLEPVVGTEMKLVDEGDEED